MITNDISRVTAGLLLLATVFTAKGAVPTANELAKHRPQTWFHLIGGNVSKDGITADLEAIARAGIGGIQFFPYRII